MRLEKDNIDNLFDRQEGAFDVYEPSENHTALFAEKLQQAKNKKNGNVYFKKWWYIAASVVIIITATITVFNTPATKQVPDIAKVSPELYQSQTYFTSVINEELEKIKKENSPATQKIVEDAIVQLNKLEKDYNSLTKDLLSNGADKRIIFAMITNLQNRIELLQNVLETIDQVKALKTESYESNI